MGSIFDSGYHKQYNFDNGYGASVIWNLASYGHEEMLFEVAVIDLETDDLCYDTPVTDDVVGFLDFYEVVDILDKIKNLPAKCRTNETRLLSCLCGGESRLTVQHFTNDSHIYWVRCIKCGMEGPHMHDEELSIEAWNGMVMNRTCEFNVIEEFIPGSRANICECSNCRYRCAYGFIVDEHFKYCPNCGAKVVEHERHSGIVRCRDCKYYYEAEEYHPHGNYDRRCCKYFVTYNEEVEPDGFCAWGQIPTNKE